MDFGGIINGPCESNLPKGPRDFLVESFCSFSSLTLRKKIRLNLNNTTSRESEKYHAVDMYLPVSVSVGTERGLKEWSLNSENIEGAV